MGSQDRDEEPTTQTLKVNVTEEQRMRLHTLKILSGKNVSRSVREALELYFDELADDPDGQELLEQTDQLIKERV